MTGRAEVHHIPEANEAGSTKGKRYHSERPGLDHRHPHVEARMTRGQRFASKRTIRQSGCRPVETTKRKTLRRSDSEGAEETGRPRLLQHRPRRHQGLRLIEKNSLSPGESVATNDRERRRRRGAMSGRRLPSQGESEVESDQEHLLHPETMNGKSSHLLGGRLVANVPDLPHDGLHSTEKR